MILVDTSNWIEFIRAKGRVDVQKRLQDLIRGKDAAWCDAVKLELWNGANSSTDAERLHELDEMVELLPMPYEVWPISIQLAVRARSNGITVPPADLLIAACAKVNRVEIESLDSHFEMLAKLKL